MIRMMMQWTGTLWGLLRVWFGLGLLGVLCIVWTPVALVLYPFLPGRTGQHLGRAVIMRGFRFYLWNLQKAGIYIFDWRELDNLSAAMAEQGPVILAANHPGLIDAVVITARIPQTTCIIKRSLMDSVLFGAGARLARYLRNDPALDMMLASREALQAGYPLLIFPEGTRTVQPPLNPCKASIALISERSGIPVQTLLIETSSGFLGKGAPMFRHSRLPIHYRIRLGKRFEPPQRGQVAAFVAELENHFRQQLGESCIHDAGYFAPLAVQALPPDVAGRHLPR